MLNSQILENKVETVDNDGDQMIDLFVINTPELFREQFKFEIITVDQSNQFRPLSLAQSIYDTTEFWDLLLKFNGISNPFDIQTGDLIIAPELDFLRGINVSPVEFDIDLVGSISQEINRSRAERDDDKRKSFIAQRKTRPTQGTNEGIEFDGNEVIIDTNTEEEANTFREKILKRALERAIEEDNTVLSKQISNLLKCDID